MPRAEPPPLLRRRFLLGADAVRPASAAAAIDPSCLAFRGIACMTCRDACLAGAIRFTLALGGARPGLDPAACTGCGDCAAVCPAQAISIAAGTAHPAGAEIAPDA